MSHQRPSSRPAAAAHVALRMKRTVTGSFMQGLTLCALILGVAVLGACGQRGGEAPAPDPGPTSTATPLPAVVTFTPQPPTATNTPAPTPTESVPPTPTPTVTVTDTAPAAMEPPATDASVTVLGEMNVRSGPGTDYDVVGNATADEEFPITGRNSEGDWWRIDFQGQPGWIHAPFVVAANAEDVPVVGTGMTEAAAPDGGPTEAAPAPPDAIVTVGGDMNVRSGPGEEYDRIGGATAGEAFRITGRNEDGDWWQIDFGGETGWILAPFVTAANAVGVPVVRGSVSEAPGPASDPETAAPETEGATVTVLGDMNIRSGPGTDFDRIGGAAEGEVFAITGKSPDGEWWQIEFDGQSGWIFAPYVTAANVEDVPVVGDSQAAGSVPEDSTTETPATPDEPLATAGGDLDLNVRKGPGTEYDRIGGANEGEEFAITGKSSDGMWWQIDFDGQSGWLYAPFVNATNAENVPVVTPEAQGSTPADSGRRAAVARSSDGDVLGIHFEEE